MLEITILRYQTAEGRIPFDEWIESIVDKPHRTSILVRIDRLRFGSFGDWKALGKGVCEMRIHHGPGFRIYFARRERFVLLLLCGGDKHSQSSDIARAKAYWSDYEKRT